MFWRLEKLFWVSVIALVVVFSSIAITKANPPAQGNTPAQVQQTAQSWSGWVGKIQKSGSNYTLAVGEPAARVYTLDGNAAELENLTGTLTKVQGEMNGTTLKVTKAESAGMVTKAEPERSTWSSLGPEGTIEALAVDPNNPSILYAGASGGTVYKSTDSGKNWKATDLTSSFKILNLAIDPQEPNTVYAGTGRGVFRSRDGGQNWTLVNSGLTYPTVKALAIDPQHSSTLYAGTWGNGVFKNTSREVRWSELNTGLKRPFIYALAVDRNHPNSVYAGTPNGVLRSTDGGSTWNQVTSKSMPIVALVIASQDSSVLYAAANNWVPQKGNVGSLLKSTDGGITWNTVESGLPQHELRALAVHLADSNTLYVGTAAGVFRSTDGGATWSEMNTGLTNKDVFALAVDPGNPNQLYAGTAGGVFELTLTR